MTARDELQQWVDAHPTRGNAVYANIRVDLACRVLVEMDEAKEVNRLVVRGAVAARTLAAALLAAANAAEGKTHE